MERVRERGRERDKEQERYLMVGGRGQEVHLTSIPESPAGGGVNTTTVITGGGVPQPPPFLMTLQ